MNYRRRKQLVVVGVVTTVACVLATQPRAAEEEPSHRGDGTLPQPVVDTHHLMELFNQPVYKYLKEAMHEEPSDDDGWSTLQDRGLQAAEVMNLVAIRNDEESDHPSWEKHLRSAQQAGLELSEAAKSMDWEGTRQAYQALIRNCNDCHQDVAPDHAPQVTP
ncbi:MAG: hypothetical protein KDA52_00685 [Planctomycetaceae bacterium]|nr:hypothetical protein [Planctomycetaceae bacterium]